MRKQIESRGNPDGPSLHGEIEPVHYRMPTPLGGASEAKPACLTGAFNIRWTKNWDAVTCSKCKPAKAERAAQLAAFADRVYAASEPVVDERENPEYDERADNFYHDGETEAERNQ